MIYAPPADIELASPAPIAWVATTDSAPVQFAEMLRGEPIARIEIGDTVYPFRFPRRERIGPGTYSVEGVASEIVGEGRNTLEAREDFRAKFHVTFQQIFSRRAFDRSAEEDRLARMLGQLVNLYEYDRCRTYTQTAAGEIASKRKPSLVTVRWATGVQEDVALSVAPAEFAALSIGQSFEAVVRRQNITDELKSIEHARRIGSLTVTPRERDQFWDAVKKV